MKIKVYKDPDLSDRNWEEWIVCIYQDGVLISWNAHRTWENAMKEADDWAGAGND